MSRTSLTRVLIVLVLACMAVTYPRTARAVSMAGTGWKVVAPARTPPDLYWPAGVAMDTHGTMYVADSDARTVLALSSRGQLLRQWTNAGTHQLGRPSTVAVDRSGHVYVGDATSGTIVAFTTSGHFLTSWPVASSTSGSLQGFPIAVDDQGAVWAAVGLRIQSFSPSGKRLRSWDTHIRSSVNNRFPCVITPGQCAGDIAISPLGITVHAGRVYLLFQALTCGGGGKGTCRSYYYVQAWTEAGRFQREWLVGKRLPGFGISDPAGLAVDRTGNLLVAVGSDLKTFSPTTGKIGSFPWSPPPWPNPPPGASATPDITGITADARGKIYLAVGEMHLLQRLSPAGNIEATWGNQVSDTFSRPNGIAVDPSGVMYLADTNDGVVKKLSPSGLTVGRWGTAGFPLGAALDRAGNVYVTSVRLGESTLQIFSPGGTVLRQWALPGREGSALGSGAGALAVDGAGNVYVSETDAMRVVKFSADGKVLATWQEQPGAPITQYLHPTALTLDAHGDLWVAYTLPDRIVEYSPAGTERASWPLPLLHSTMVSDPATGLAFDPTGHLWAVAAEEVMDLSTEGKVLRSWSTWGRTPGTFIEPSGIAAGPGGTMYVVDNWNNWVQKLVP